ncbi:ribosomal RNA-processing protein 7-domain-containing protein [Naematelia encephala]|uniref:Ribosomal RNA-processing protein 7-domain-containing protein n=1 Tax=Naematelia encephala TaxID=71784 RepID=A0A1Y2BLR6_9TREE|nr:ribosomal RNA-processing protein 7-domain-containing protein [Naematelia encephala]
MPKSTRSKTEKLKTKSAGASTSSRPSSSTSTPLKTAAPRLYSSFLPIPLSLPSSSSSKPTTHYIYARPHSSKPSSPDDERTVFVANLPVDMTERDLRVVFGRWGVIDSVTFGAESGGDILEDAVRGLPVDDSSDNSESDDEDHEGEREEEEEGEEEEERREPQFIANGKPLSRRQRPRRRKNGLPTSVPDIIPLPSLNPREKPYGLSGLSTARVTYLDDISLTRLFSTSPSSISLPKYNASTSTTKDSSSNPTGLEYYIAKHTSLRPTLASIKAFSDTSMARFDHLHSLLLSSRAKAQGAGALVDEDGFTVVVRGGRYGRTGGRGDGVGKAGVGVARKGFAKDVLEGKKAKKLELQGLYKFQRVDQKRKELADLRAKFEDDKLKVEEMKKNRRFKPY